MNLLKHMIAVAIVSVVGTAAFAADLALVLTTRTYDGAGSERDAAQFMSVAQGFRSAGFQIFGGQDQTLADMTATVEQFRDASQSQPLGQRVVVLSGRMATGGFGHWLLARDAGRVSDLSIGQGALPIDVISAELANHPAHALMVLLPVNRRGIDLGPGLETGIVGLDVPQGVAMMQGPTRTMLNILNNQILRGGFPMGQVAQSGGRDMVFAGFLPMDLPLAGTPEPLDQSDASYWSAVQDIGLPEGYQAYLNRFPNGLFADHARRQLAVATPSPEEIAQQAERALGLSRDQRREIQRQLTLLGFDTRGVDGLIGPGSRRAIRAFQQSRGFDNTGYLTADLIALLRNQAEAEALRRKQQRDREDRAFWERTGALGAEDGLRAYLERYPDGIHADIARTRLQSFGPSEAEINAAWTRAEAMHSIDGYEAFITRYPSAVQVAEADARIQKLRAETAELEAATQRDAAEERAVSGNQIAMLLVERGLAKSGLNPGPIDGRIDGQTRVALKAFQAAEGLPATGYVSQTTMLRLTVRAAR